MRGALIAISIVPLLAAACGSDQQQEPPPAVSVPLELDPTENYDLPAWWTNGDQLLHLGEASSYALYEGANRYRRPAQRGRWSQLSYAAIRLEPYAQLSREATRASISRVGDALMLGLPGQEPMMGLDCPPPVIEDRLLGEWTAEFGTLRLADDMRYVYTLDPGRTRLPAAVTSHSGTWQVEVDTVILRPDSAGVEPVLIRIRERDDTIHLDAPDGRLARRAAPNEGD